MFSKIPAIIRTLLNLFMPARTTSGAAYYQQLCSTFRDPKIRLSWHCQSGKLQMRWCSAVATMRAEASSGTA
jgi:hypothetical protein